MGGTMHNFGIWGNQWTANGGTKRGGIRSAAFKKLSKNPSKLRLVRELKNTDVAMSNRPTNKYERLVNIIKAGIPQHSQHITGRIQSITRT